jgi:hypothetical protein
VKERNSISSKIAYFPHTFKLLEIVDIIPAFHYNIRRRFDGGESCEMDKV